MTMPEPPEVYFPKRVDIDENGCWNWTLRREKGGYGVCKVAAFSTPLAHRASYMAFRGPIPDGLVLDHLCRNRACVNPDHLEVVTPRENTLRSPGKALAAINAGKTHCDSGHEFNEQNTYVSKGRRSCRACNRAAAARYKARRAVQ